MIKIHNDNMNVVKLIINFYRIMSINLNQSHYIHFINVVAGKQATISIY